MKTVALLLLALSLGLAPACAEDAKFQPFSLESRSLSTTSNATVNPAPADTPAPDAATTNVPVAVAGIVLDDRHKLGPGDKVSFRVIEDREDAKPLLVTDSGELDVPYVGRVKVADRTCQEVAAELKTLLEQDYYFRATVVLGLDQINRVLGRVYVWGEVRNQGPVEIPANENLTVGKAILRAGGFNDWAKRSKVKVVRAAKTEGGAKEEIIVDMDAVLKEGKTENDVPLQPDDFIIVPRSKINF
jgi:protein involved in polysaccharide export with SLBB domain